MSNIVSNLSDNDRASFTRVVDDKHLDATSLLTCREVCKDFKNIVDTHLMNNPVTSQEVDLVMVQLTLKKRTSESSPAKKSVIKKLYDFIFQKNSIVRNVQYYISPFVTSICKDVMNRSLPKVKEALHADDSEESQVNIFVKQIEANDLSFSNQLKMEGSTVGSALKLREDKDYNTLLKESNEIQRLNKRVDDFTTRLNSFNHICNLFGGEKEFNKLPVLDISKLEDKDRSYIDYIPLEALTAPVMRGVDKYNRPFIVLRAERKDDPSEKRAQVFFQRYGKQGDWADAQVKRCWSMLSIGGYIIDNGKPQVIRKDLVKSSNGHYVNVDVPGPFQLLGDFIKNGGNDEYRLA